MLPNRKILAQIPLFVFALLSTGLTSSSLTFASAQPPIQNNVEWLKVPYDQAEDQLLALFQHDLPAIQQITPEVSIFEIRTKGSFPSDHRDRFRSKMERLFLISSKIKVKQCDSCDEARLYRTESGELKYETYSTEKGRAAKIAADMDLDYLIYAELTYLTEDLQLRVKLVEPATGKIAWVKEYSLADATRVEAGGSSDSSPDQIGHGDSLSRVILGEIAFTIALSPGLMMVPTGDTGTGTQLNSMPSVDLFIGERFDRGRKNFGFIIGGAMSPTENADKGKVVKNLFRAAPRYTYIFNPYNVTSARHAIFGEGGGLFGDGIGTGYVGFGYEMKMINRYGISLMPFYIFNSKIKNDAPPPAAFADLVPPSPEATFGGFGALLKLTMQW